MSRPRAQRGWLLYAGPLGVIAANVLDADISMRASTLDVTSAVSPVQHLIYGRPDITFTAQLAGKFDWQQNATPGEPPHLGALLALARNHPEEYQQCRDAESVLEALGG